MFIKYKWRRIISSLLVTVMMFTMLPINMIVFAEGDTSGIGVINNAFTSGNADEDYNSYQVIFYYKDTNGTLQPYSHALIDDNNSFTINEDGYFTVKKGDSVDLLNSNMVKKIIDDNNITQVKITFIDNGQNNPKNYMLHSRINGKGAELDSTNENSVVYTIEKEEKVLDENNNPVTELVYDANGEPTIRYKMKKKELKSSDFSRSTFTSTETFEYEVDVYWHDRGENRPTIDDPNTTGENEKNDGIKIKQDGSEYSVALVENTYVVEDSNHWVYKYEVPKFKTADSQYVYTAYQLLYTENNNQIYRLEPENPENGNNRFDFYSKTTFDFNINWHKGQEVVSNDDDAIKDYILNNFELFDETDYELDEQGNIVYDGNGNPKPKKLTIDKSKITITRVFNENDEATGEVKISISGFDEITKDGHAKIYYLQEKENNVIHATGGDTWKVNFDNGGVHSSDLTKLYQDGTINNIITGKIEKFEVEVEWLDGSNRDVREGITTPGNVVLWRYAKTGAADDKDRSAQIATSLLVDTDANGNIIYVNDQGNTVQQGTEGAKPKYLTGNDHVVFNDLEKYDRFGNEYVYYAKEVLNTQAAGMENYYASYSYKDENNQTVSDSYALNGGKITNTRSGERNFVVDAVWKAAARQGGNASVTYKLQRVRTNPDGYIVDGSNSVYHFEQGKLLNSSNQEVDINTLDVWEDVQTPEIDETGKITNNYIDSITVTGFQAETMEKTVRFGPMPQYNSQTGDEYIYRIVQTDITRYDSDSNSPGTFTDPTYQSTSSPITINGDKYNIIVYPEQPGENDNDKYTFTYQLTGDIELHINKIWDDTANQNQVTHENDIINATVEFMNFGENQFQEYHNEKSTDIGENQTRSEFTQDLDNNPNTENGSDWVVQLLKSDEISSVETNTTRTWSRTIHVPIYDGDGHEYQYRVLEKENLQKPDMLKNYTIEITEYDKATNTYKIKNTYTPPGGPTLDFSKTWQDDGDLLHRPSLDITYTEAVGRKGGTGTSTYNDETQTYSYNASTEEGVAGTATITEGNSWKARISRLTNYTYNSDYFTEKENGNDESTYTKLNKIDATTVNTDDQKYQWIYQLLTTNYDSEKLVANSSNGEHLKSESLKDVRIVKFDYLTGIMKTGQHYYAVEQKNHSINDLEFVNTRIGVVSYKIKLDWCMGGWETSAATNSKKFKVKIQGKVNNQPVKFTYTDEGNNTHTNCIEKEITIQGGTQEYYLTDLPKYNAEGKIIDWEIEEIELDGQLISEGKCTINGTPCVVTMTDPTYLVGEHQHTDDLISVTITNRFEDKTTATVNKMWYDDNNALGLRSDTYLQLWYRSDNEGWKQLGGDYVWEATALTEWSYTFNDLPKFDEKGYPYEYAIKELDIRDYSTSTYQNTTGYQGGQPYNMTQVHSSLEGNYVPNGGWFVDRISGEVVIKGQKLWSNISPVLENSHYPIANIELKKQYKYKTNRGSNTYTVGYNDFTQDTTDANKYVATKKISGLAAGTYKVSALTEGLVVSPADEQTVENDGEITFTLTVSGQPNSAQSFKLQRKVTNITNNSVSWVDTYDVMTTTEDKNKIGQTSIYNGEKSFLFQQDKSWTENDVTHQNAIINDSYVTNSDGTIKQENVGTQASPVYSMVLPKFDDKGAVITYSLEEKAISGYVFEISKDKIVNDYTGGRPLEITVTKKWENMEQVEYPSVKLILHQVMFAKTMEQNGTDYVRENGKYVYTPIEYGRYEKILRKGDEGCTDNNTWTYTFGLLNGTARAVGHEKENIRQFAPDGTCFAYFITEQLINNDNESVVLNAKENEANPDYLGDFYKDSDIEIARNDSQNSTLYVYHDLPILSEGLSFKVTNLIQPGSIEGETCDEQNKDTKITRTASITNSYKPSEKNFQGKLIINKTWTNHNNATTENGKNDEFNDIKNYTFKVSRLTKTSFGGVSIGNVDMFTIKTWDETNKKPVVTPESTNGLNLQIVSGKEMAAYDSSNTKINEPITENSNVAYYEETWKINKSSYNAQEVNITIKIYKGDTNSTDYNKVEIDGLAIRAQDAIKYTYKIEEILTDLPAYKNANNPQSSTMQEINVNNETKFQAEFTLANELNVFTLNLYKVFGKQYIDEQTGEEKTEILSSSDYYQYFNDAFVNQLEFELYRKKEGDSQYQKYEYKIETGETEYKYHVTETGTGTKIYRRVFTDLPMYSDDGKKYYYQVQEIGPTNISSDNPARYITKYTNDNSQIGEDSCTDIYVNNNETELNTYVRNIFKAKQIYVKKYWDDNNNADGLRPNEVNVKIKEHIPNDSHDNNFNGTYTDIVRTLKIDSLTQGNNWRKLVELPKYFYNGANPILGLTYGIEEDKSNLLPNGYNDPTYTYMISKNGMYETKVYNQPIAVSETVGGALTELEALNVYNSKNPVNSKLTFDKTWSDLDNKWELRPDHIYVKVTNDSKKLISALNSGIIVVPGNEANPSTNVLSVRIRNLPGTGTNYKVQQKIIPTGETQAVWTDIPSTVTPEKTTEQLSYIDVTVTVPNKTMPQVFRIIDTSITPTEQEPNNNVVKLDRYNNTLTAIVNEDSVHNPVKKDNMNNTLGAKDTKSYTPDNTTKEITVPKSRFLNELKMCEHD